MAMRVNNARQQRGASLDECLKIVFQSSDGIENARSNVIFSVFVCEQLRVCCLQVLVLCTGER